MAAGAKIAVFGCGYWGRNHVRTLAEIGALACVVDTNADAAATLAEEHNTVARAAEDVFADPAVDAIVMALPAQFHSAIACRAFEAGKHVFAEKPIALSVSDATAMVDAAQKANRVLMTGHILCYHNAFRAIMALIEDGTLGTVNYVQSHRLGFGKFHAKFDAVWDLAPHDLSLLLSVAKRSPSHVQSIPVSLSNGQTDLAHIALDFDDGLKSHVIVSRHSPYVERRFTVIGDKAMVVWDDTEQDWNRKVSLHRYQAEREGDSWSYEKQDGKFIPCAPGMALTDELSHFIDCIKTGEKPLTDGGQGLDVVRILNQIGR